LGLNEAKEPLGGRKVKRNSWLSIERKMGCKERKEENYITVETFVEKCSFVVLWGRKYQIVTMKETD
jgi:hypothetical protein